MLGGLLTTAAALRAEVGANADLGADEVMLYCWAADPDQAERMAAALPWVVPGGGSIARHHRPARVVAGPLP